MTKEQIHNTFKYHAPHGDQAARYERLREEAREVALLIQEFCPESREKSLALTNLQQAIMWANAAIAINESVEPASAEKPPDTPPDITPGP